MLKKSLNNKVNWPEFGILRAGFSLYGGWLSAATILNTAYYLKSAGFTMFEEEASFIVLLAGSLLFSLFSLKERDPIFGLVYVWVLYGIRAAQPDEANMLAQLIVTHLSLTSGIAYLCVEESENG